MFWHNIDPLDASGRFCDRGDQHHTAIFTHDVEQFQAAQASKRALEASQRLGRPIQTEIVTSSTFFPAEDYRQDYYQKHPLKCKFYGAVAGATLGCGSFGGVTRSGEVLTAASRSPPSRCHPLLNLMQGARHGDQFQHTRANCRKFKLLLSGCWRKGGPTRRVPYAGKIAVPSEGRG